MQNPPKLSTRADRGDGRSYPMRISPNPARYDWIGTVCMPGNAGTSVERVASGDDYNPHSPASSVVPKMGIACPSWT
jgi:hypothetical protein